MYAMTEEEFERAIDEALRSIPAEFLEALENVVIVAQDEPDAYQLERAAENDAEWSEEELAAWLDETQGGAAEGGEWDETDGEDAFDEDEGEGTPMPEDDYDDLLGLYDGIPLTERDEYDFCPPDVITVFKGPHERLCETREEMVEEIRKTVVHEIGHYFGMDEDDIQRMGYA